MPSAKESSLTFSEVLSRTSEEYLGDFSLDDTQMEFAFVTHKIPSVQISSTKSANKDSNKWIIYVLSMVVLIFFGCYLLNRNKKSIPQVIAAPPTVSLNNAHFVTNKSEDAVKELFSMQEDIFKAINEVNETFLTHYNESDFKLALRDALERRVRSVKTTLLTTLKSTKSEHEIYKNEIWENKIKVYFEAINEPLIKSAISTVRYLSRISYSYVSLGNAIQIYDASTYFKLQSAYKVKLECPKYIPNISKALQTWYADNSEDAMGHRHKVEILEKSFTSLTQLLLRASELVDQLTPMYIDNVTAMYMFDYNNSR